MKPVPILSEEQQLKIVEAIVKAEYRTSGEIRVHVEPKCKTDPVSRAVKVFDRLEMYDTAARNGVLIYLAYETRVCAIIGDVAINEVIPAGFWDGILADMQSAFAAGSFTEGIIGAVEAVGDALSEFFPYQSDDVNEQPDEISFFDEDEEDEEEEDPDEED
ncbi:MAG: TPM domain-containing protein [Bacteroidales bacterium]|nr:TPM domain-containing protein [Bacteroidales bacterium]